MWHPISIIADTYNLPVKALTEFALVNREKYNLDVAEDTAQFAMKIGKLHSNFPPMAGMSRRQRKSLKAFARRGDGTLLVRHEEFYLQHLDTINVF